ncbi:NYN domain-containing protein [Candidatus Roizmanbacteria bacterium]|nr:NYN domain-containing protein [Candidatus Roizmanbacteria bacterium]
MFKKNPKQKNYAFIDSQNLNLGVKSQGWELDFKRFRIYLTDKYQVEKAFLFIGYIEKNKPLYEFLKRSEFILIFKPILETKRDKKIIIKGNVDAELVLHTMIEYPNYTRAVIVSGDGDFHCLIEYLDKKNKLFRVIVPNQRSYSSLFLPFKKYLSFININLKEKLAKKNGSVVLRTKP